MFAMALLIGVAGASTLNEVPADWRLDAPRTDFSQLVLDDEADQAAAPDMRYRLTFADAPAPTSKDRAFADDGKRCGLMGPPVCPSSGHTILRSGESPVATIVGSLGQ